jgi:hypothetical protein
MEDKVGGGLEEETSGSKTRKPQRFKKWKDQNGVGPREITTFQNVELKEQEFSTQVK